MAPETASTTTRRANESAVRAIVDLNFTVADGR
jgi:hypothetical protein